MTTAAVDKPQAIMDACMLSAAGAAVFLLLPMVVGTAIDSLGYSESEAGFLASSYFAGYMLSATSAFFWIRKISWRVIAFLGYAGLSGGLASAAALTHFNLIASTLFISGCGAGALFGLGVTIISDTRKPDRNFGLVLMTQQATAALLLFTLPDTVIAKWGFAGLNISLAMILGLFVISATWIPAVAVSGKSFTPDHPSDRTTLTSKLWLGLAALTVYFAALSGVWAFVERLADHNDLST
ncbi:MAG: hypothetical protein ACR2PS_01490, partial [Pseudomonadales bacterium]